MSEPFREEEAIQLDGLNAAQIKELREKSEKHVFQAEVNRMMKLIINSLYKNKEVSRSETECLHLTVLPGDASAENTAAPNTVHKSHFDPPPPGSMSSSYSG